MTDAPEPEGTFVPFSKEYLDARDHYVPDAWLGVLVQMCETHPEVSMGLTITVGGSVISGDLVGRTAWIDALVEVAGEQNPFIPALQMHNNDANEEADADDELEPSYERFIHLRNARHWTGDGPVVDADTFWRGRLNAVDGWSFGNIAAATS